MVDSHSFRYFAVSDSVGVAVGTYTHTFATPPVWSEQPITIALLD